MKELLLPYYVHWPRVTIVWRQWTNRGKWKIGRKFSLSSSREGISKHFALLLRNRRSEPSFFQILSLSWQLKRSLNLFFRELMTVYAYFWREEFLVWQQVLVDYDDDEDEEQQKDKKKDEKNTSRQHVSLGINEQSFKKIREDTKSAQPDKHDSKYSTHSSSRDHNRRSPKKSPDFGRRRSRERSHRRDRSRSNERNRRVRRRSRSRDDDRRGKRDEEEGHHRSRENERRKNDHWRERRDEVRGSRPQETRSNERRRYQSPSSPSRRRRRRSSQDKTSNSSTHSDRTHSPPNQMLKGIQMSVTHPYDLCNNSILLFDWLLHYRKDD